MVKVDRVLRYGKSLVTGMVIGALLSFASLAAAGDAWGSYGYYGPQSGVNYANINQIWTTQTTISAYTYVSAGPSPIASNGFIGVRPRLFKSNGALCYDWGSYFYNSGQTAWFGAQVSSHCGNAACYAHGYTQAWHGTGYYTYGSFKSPNQNYPG
jgi:hypothetical protein